MKAMTRKAAAQIAANEGARCLHRRPPFLDYINEEVILVV